jgi:hypothetical protein
MILAGSSWGEKVITQKKKVCENVYDVVLICVQLFLVCFGMFWS